MTCTDIQERLSRFIDDELEADEQGTMFAHLSTCPECQRFLREALRIHRSLAFSDVAAAPESIERRVMERIAHHTPLRPPRADVWSVRVALPLPAAFAMAVLLVVGSWAVWPLLLEPPARVRTADETLEHLPGGLRSSIRVSQMLLGE